MFNRAHIDWRTSDRRQRPSIANMVSMIMRYDNANHRLASQGPCQHHLPLIGNGLALNAAIKKQPTIFRIKGIEIDMV